MLSLVKILFIIVAVIFVVSYLGDAQFVRDFTLTEDTYEDSGTPVPRGTYTRSYDTNDDGTVSDREYELGERRRIEEELEYLRGELAHALADERESPYADSISLSEGSADASDPDEEYVEVRADLSNDASVTITGWKLKSIASGRTVTIGKGIPPNRTSLSRANERTVVLKPAEKAYIVSGDPSSRRSFVEDTGTLSDDDWLVSLDANRGLWRNSHDVILLLDANGLVVDYVSY